MATEITLHNIKDGFSSEKRAEDLVPRTLKGRPDAAVFLEAYAEHRLEPVAGVVEEFERYGYSVAHGLYEDDDDRQDRHGMMVIIKNELLGEAPPAVIRLGGRSAIKATLAPQDSEPFDLFAIHFDDRSEDSRLRMVADIARHADIDERGKFMGPTAVASSIVGLPKDEMVSRSLRFIRPAVSRLPQADPNPINLPPKWPYRFGLARRLSGMALGMAYDQLEAYGVRSSDAYGVPTIPSLRPLVQLDKIFVTPHFDIKWYEISKHIASSDHGLYTPAATHRRYSVSLEQKSMDAGYTESLAA